MQVSTIISLIALLFAATSLGLSAYNILRDRGRLLAWSEIYYDSSKDLDDPPPGLKIRLVNAGRRPVVLTSLVKESSSMTWLSSIQPPDLPTDDRGYISRLPKMEDFSAQKTSLILQEGGVYEVIIEHEDRHGLIGLIEDEIHYAKKLYVEDVLKKRYYIKDSKENIDKLYEYGEKRDKST